MGAEYDKVVVSKYKSISQRSFKTRLELFLFDLIVKEQISYHVKISDFIQFQVSDELVKVYEQSWQTDEIIINNKIQITSRIDKKYKEWGNSNEATKKELFKAYVPHFEENALTIAQFKEVFPEDPKMRICHYTNLSDFEIIMECPGKKSTLLSMSGMRFLQLPPYCMTSWSRNELSTKNELELPKIL